MFLACFYTASLPDAPIFMYYNKGCRHFASVLRHPAIFQKKGLILQQVVLE